MLTALQEPTYRWEEIIKICPLTSWLLKCCPDFQAVSWEGSVAFGEIPSGRNPEGERTPHRELALLMLRDQEMPTVASPKNMGSSGGSFCFAFPQRGISGFYLPAHLIHCEAETSLSLGSGALRHPGGACGWGPFHNWMYSATSWPRYSFQRFLV